MIDTPARIGPYVILAELGKAGSVTSYRALQAAPNRTVTIQVLPQELVSDPVLLERFHQQAKQIALLQHPNLVQILDIGEDSGRLYVVTEFLAGSTLHELLRQKRLTLQQALQVVKEVAKGLDYAHRNGVLHRQLNSKNILVSPDLSVVKVTNMGVGPVESPNRYGDTITTDQMTLGSFHYLAPEQTEDPSKVDQRADIYSLGVIFYELLTGRVPVGKFSLPSQLNSELRSEVDPIVLKCLADDPDARYPTVLRLLADLDRLEETLRIRLIDELQGISRGTSKLFRPPGLQGRRRTLLIYGAGALLLVVLAALALMLPRGNSGGSVSSQPVAAPAPVPAATSGAPPAAPEASSPALPPSQSARPAQTPPGNAANTPTARPQEAQPTKPPATSAAPVANAAKPASPPPKDLRPAARPEIPSGRDSTAGDYQVALGKFEAKLYDQALADARLLLEEHPTSSVAPQTYLLVAQIHLAQDHNEDAMAALIELHNRYPKDPRAPEALFQLAQLVLQSKRKDKELDAAGTFGELADQYPTNPWAVRALAAKAQLEEREKMRQQDPILSLTVPSELVTYRALVERFPTASAAEIALWKLGELYSELKRYDLAVQSYAKLGEGFPNTQYDAWFEAGELYEKKLKDSAQAMAAYLKVPDRSRHFKEAQKRASKLQND